jgi:threonine aldolase
VWQIAKDNNIKVHTDGARILNSAAAQGVPVSEIMKYSDSVNMCFSKVNNSLACSNPSMLVYE